MKAVISSLASGSRIGLDIRLFGGRPLCRSLDNAEVVSQAPDKEIGNCLEAAALRKPRERPS